MKIVSLDVENVKRITAVHIEPDGTLCVVGGQNGAGKTSVLDSIMYALAGKKEICERPLRDGSDHGHVSVDLGEAVVTRTFTPTGGGSLKVSVDDMSARSPQAWLDKRIGELSFDPLEFSRKNSREQAQVLREISGTDTRELDAERKDLFNRRTAQNRRLKDKKGALNTHPYYEDAPGGVVSVRELMNSLEKAEHTQTLVGNAHEAMETAQRHVDEAIEQRAELQRQLDELEENILILGDRSMEAMEELERERELALDPQPFREQIQNVDGLNDQVRANQARRDLAEEVTQLTEQSKKMTAGLDDIDRRRAEMLSAAEFPIEGLSFDEDGVTYDGVPFDQASSSQQLRVSLAMGISMNPTIRIVLIRDGSLLDQESLELVAKTAEEHDIQVWIERVGDGPECSVVIEDGSLRS